MLYSETRNFVFIAVPKTGTTAIQKRLMEIDPDLHRNRVRSASGDMVEMPTHATAYQVRSVMGKRAEPVVFVAFMRDPRAVLASKYHFYRSGRAARKQGLAAGPRDRNGVRFNLGRALRVLSAKALPLPLWARLYPYSSSASFLTDGAGQVIVDRIGLAERLQEDVDAIFGTLGYDPADLQLAWENRTEYDRSSATHEMLGAIAERRLSQDCALYDRVRRGGAAPLPTEAAC